MESLIDSDSAPSRPPNVVVVNVYDLVGTFLSLPFTQYFNLPPSAHTSPPALLLSHHSPPPPPQNKIATCTGQE